MMVIFLGILCSLLNIGLSITYPVFNTRFDVIIDTCINNVTIDNGDDYQEYGSLICRCGTYNVICFSYEENDCSGNVWNTISWGGCEQDSTTKYLYNIDGCAAAQESAAGGNCGYFVTDLSWQNNPNYYNAIKPLGVCQDYNCGSNSDEDSRSCIYQRDGSNITYTTYNDYECTTSPNIADRDYGYLQMQPGSEDCTVTVTRYSIGDDAYDCGSKNSKYKVNVKSTPQKNYMQESLDAIPQSIGACMERRDGFHKYSWKYQCSDDGETVYKKIYLDSNSCSGQDYVVQNFSSSNYTIFCSGGKASGKYGSYQNDCGDQNWDAAYYEYPKLYGECIPFRSNPTDTWNDGSLYQDVPFQSNLRIVHSCANIKGWQYDAHFFFATSDCTGDYLFNVDETGEYSNYQNIKQYPCKNSERTKIMGCSNSNINVQKKAKISLS